MNRIAFTALISAASIFLAGCVCGTKPVVIKAEKATGETYNTANPQPIWTFYMTNLNRTECHWGAGIQFKDPNHDYVKVAQNVAWPEGTLAPGEVFDTNMIVPAQKGLAWRAYVTSWGNTTFFRKTYYDEWHQ